MGKRFVTHAALVIGLLIVSVPMFAHHGNAAFATGEKRTVKGTVTEWTWANPHCYLKLDVKDDKGNIVRWTAEVMNPTVMTSRGWGPRDFKVGDEVTMTGIVAKNGTPIIRIDEVTLADGRKLYGNHGPDGAPAE